MNDEINTEPLISVIIPSYNRSRTILRAVSSVLAQKLDYKFEVIVVNDGSTDETDKILKKANFDIEILNQKNLGPGAARNKGLAYSQGKLIAFLDSDDEMLPGRLALQTEYMLKHPDVILCFGAIIFYDNQTLPFISTLDIYPEWNILSDPYTHIMTSVGECVNTMTVMVRKNVFCKSGGFREDLYCAEDTDLWLRLGQLGTFAYNGIPMTIVDRSNREDRLSQSNSAIMDGAIVRVDALKKDNNLSAQQKLKATNVCKIAVESRLRFVWLEKGNKQLRYEIKAFQSIFGFNWVLKWYLISIIPQSTGKIIKHIYKYMKNSNS